MSDQNTKGTNRRDMLKCLGWGGAGLIWGLNGGIPFSAVIGSAEAAALPAEGLYFAQISDTHFGFAKEANPDATGTAALAVAQIAALPRRPTFVLHTGDVSHLSKESEFVLAADNFAPLRDLPMFFTPGEHDVLDEGGGTLFQQRFAPQGLGGRPTNGTAPGWYSFSHEGAHFICLVNVLDFATSGLGQLGAKQLAWLADDLRGQSTSTPIILFTHIPLWSLYPQWGWGTSDSEQALALLRRFGSVTVLNGHIHQIIQKVEGRVTFHTAFSTAYPQPAPGTAPSPGPLKVPAERLRTVLGIRTLELVANDQPLAVVNRPLVAS